SRPLSWLNAIGPFLILVFVSGLFLILLNKESRSAFLSTENFKTVLTQTVIVATGSLGMTMIIVSGGIDLSVGSVVALTSVLGAKLFADRVDPDTIKCLTFWLLLGVPAVLYLWQYAKALAHRFAPQTVAEGKSLGPIYCFGGILMLGMIALTILVWFDVYPHISDLLAGAAPLPKPLRDILVALIVGIAGGVVGSINGALIASFRMTPFIVTLGMLGIA